MKIAWLAFAFAIACGSHHSDRDDIAKDEVATLRKDGKAVTVTFNGDTMIVKPLDVCTKDVWPMLFGIDTGLADFGSPKSHFDIPRLVAAGIKRVECESSNGDVAGIDIPVKMEKAKAPLAAPTDTIEKINADLVDLDAKTTAAVNAVVAAQNDTDRASAKAALIRLQKRKVEMEARIARFKASH